MKPTAPPSVTTPIGILLAAGKGSRFDASGQRNKLLAPLRHGPEIGLPVAFVAARRMRNALSRVIVVIDAHGPQRQVLSEWLQKAGCEVVTTSDASDGMGASLACAVRASLMPTGTADGTHRTDSVNGSLSQSASRSLRADELAAFAPKGWIIGLADMPKIAPATIQSIASALTAPDNANTGTDNHANTSAHATGNADGSTHAASRIVAPVFNGRRGHPVGIGPTHGTALLQLTGDQGARTVIDVHGFIAIDTRDEGVVLDIDHDSDLG